MENNYTEIKEALKSAPSGLPVYLGMLTSAGHLHAAGYDVQEASLHEEGLHCRALILCPVLIGEGGSKKIDGHFNTMFEIRMNMLLTIQETAKECGMTYRTIQRWRDEGKIPVFEKDGKQLFASEILKDYAARKGHLPGRPRLR